ncbi:MAG: M1 family aminopeptidase [Candidatus Krumholzibacteria bacterium]|nr:M1 family aminopeptidase [Candidatus Krumholzibacteria bacterium]
MKQILVLALGVLPLQAEPGAHRIALELSPSTHQLSGIDSLHLEKETGSLEFLLHPKLRPSGSGTLESMETDEGLQRWSWTREEPSDLWILHYEGEIWQDVSETVFGREKVGGEISATIGEEGIYLSGSEGWYPLLEGGMCQHRLTTRLPEGWQSLTQGDLVRDEVVDGFQWQCWNADTRSDGMILVAGRFAIDRRQHGNTSIETWFFPEDRRLAETYLEETARYLDLYESFLSPYPYSKFATVENFFPTGYGMPSWTLLGQQILRLPFIVKTSLGHEICHNWWGNSVYVGEGGNWCEGLTVYCADYLYKEMKSAEAAKAYRKNTLKDYTHYSRDGKDFPLSDFVSRHDASSRAVGYGKSMFVFHMLEERIGRDAFRASLRRVIREKQWQDASWSDFFRAAEQEAGLDPMALEAMRQLWVEEKGAPMISLHAASYLDGRLTLEISVEGDFQDLPLELLVENGSGQESHLLTVQRGTQEIAVDLLRAPLVLHLDPDYHLFRRLHEDEMEATLSMILSDEEPLFILEEDLPADLEEACREFASSWVEGEARLIRGDNPAEREAARTVIWMGRSPAPFAPRPEGLQVTPFFTVFQEERFEPGASAIVYTSKRGADRGLMAVLASDPAQVSVIASKVPHYGKYSYLGFASGKNRLKGNWETLESPLSHRFGEE